MLRFNSCETRFTSHLSKFSLDIFSLSFNFHLCTVVVHKAEVPDVHLQVINCTWNTCTKNLSKCRRLAKEQNFGTKRRNTATFSKLFLISIVRFKGETSLSHLACSLWNFIICHLSFKRWYFRSALMLSDCIPFSDFLTSFIFHKDYNWIPV